MWRIWKNGDFTIDNFHANIIQEGSHQNARAGHSNVVICPKKPVTFRKLRAILVHVKMGVDIAVGPHCRIGREGDSVVARGEAGEDARVEVEHSTPSSWTIGVVEVGKEGLKWVSMDCLCNGAGVICFINDKFQILKNYILLLLLLELLGWFLQMLLYNFLQKN